MGGSPCRHGMKILTLTAHQCIVIEDSEIGVAAGTAAGCCTVAIPNQFTRHQDLSRATLRLDSFVHISVNQFFTMLSL